MKPAWLKTLSDELTIVEVCALLLYVKALLVDGELVDELLQLGSLRDAVIAEVLLSMSLHLLAKLDQLLALSVHLSHFFFDKFHSLLD